MNLKAFAIVLLTTVLLCQNTHSATLRSRKSIVGLAAVGSIQGGQTLSTVQVLDEWCTNLTTHLNTTLEKFASIPFNKSMGSSYISASSGVTVSAVLQRLTFDLNHIKIYSLLFSQIPSVMTGPQSDLCLKDGVRLLSVLIIGMDMAEAYFNDTSSFPPQFLHGNKLGSPARYQDLSREMAVLKSQMRELVIIIGNNMFSSSAHVVSV
ncbi:unnamed protein product [Porites lobata]|uniref:Uncharacterized protein n=1 Tax=Porites lobata TaxID=104759 RepID=A0ABN8N7F7_9CNID|nr:unnamed protein product [Porites lobata]